MRTLRLSLTGTVIVVLLGGLSSAVLAQEEPTAPEVPVSVTGTVTEEANQHFPSPRSEGGIAYVDGAWWTMTWEANDPRLSGEGTWSANWHGAETGPGGIGAEAPGLNIPVVALPFVNSALAGRAPFKDSVNALRSEGVRILLGPGEFEPHPPGSGGDRIADFPWQLAIASVPDQLPAPEL